MVGIVHKSKPGSDRGREMAGQEQQQGSREARERDGGEMSLPGRPSFDHPNWILDRVTKGTYPESTQVAMGRQFARVLGDMLGKNTTSREESVGVLKAALDSRIEVANFQKHLFESIDTVCHARHLQDATENLVASMEKKLEEDKLSDKLAGVHALMRATVSKMFGDMLEGPQDPRTLMSVSGDQSMHTVFGIRGQVETMTIKMTGGRLSHYFREALEKAQERYDEKKRDLRAGSAIPYDKVFELTLVVERKHQTTREVVQEKFPVKTTKDDLISSYNEALTRYAATGYADRVRAAAPRAIE
jgi:hypothetical protein